MTGFAPRNQEFGREHRISRKYAAIAKSRRIVEVRSCNNGGIVDVSVQ